MPKHGEMSLKGKKWLQVGPCLFGCWSPVSGCLYEHQHSTSNTNQTPTKQTRQGSQILISGYTREDPPRGTKTMSCFHTQKWSRVKASPARRVPCIGQSSLRNGLAGQDPALDICAEETGAFQCNVVQLFVSCALASLSLSVTGERDEKLSENKEDAVQPN